MSLSAPFPWFGGKRAVADEIWRALGNVENYVEPFFGSGAVLLARETPCPTETVNDADGFVANFWRAVQRAPDAVAWWADWPVSEIDLHARHVWLVNHRSNLAERLEGDPDFYDAQAAGWWVWGMCAWIGSGWCSGDGPWQSVDGKLVHVGDRGQGINRKLVHVGDRGRGINRKLVHVGNRGRGINRQLVHVGSRGQGITEWFVALSERLRGVRVAAGDWTRVVGDSVTWRHGLTGVLLDPPYVIDTRTPVYRHETDVAHAAAEWAIANGDHPLLRIVYCGYSGSVQFPPSWREVRWKARGGYGSQGSGRGRENAAAETLWLSPHCVGELPLFRHEATA